MFLVSDFGLTVSYVNYRLTLQVTQEYENKMCGMCGNLNGDETDDGINLSQYMIPADREKPYVFQPLKNIVFIILVILSIILFFRKTSHNIT